MKIKEQTRKLVAGCSKQCFEVVDETDEVSNHSYGKATLTRFEEIFEEYYSLTESYLSSIQAQVVLSYKLDKLTVIVASDYKTSSSLTLEFNVVPQWVILRWG